MKTATKAEIRKAIRLAVHERWCGPPPRSCGNKCEGNLDEQSLDAASQAIVALLRDEERRTP